VNDITIHYHLLIPTLVSIAGLVTIAIFRQRLFKRDKWLWTSVTVFLVIYLFIVGSATYDDIYYQWDLNRYDVDKDGIFSGDEITNVQEAAMSRLTSDVGRNFAFVTGFIFAIIISGTVYVLGRLKSKLFKN
jgi:energy-coupling factor transporter transmembrane protein EcfT